MSLKDAIFNFFPSEESIETVLRREPWAFADRMLIMQRWNRLMNPPLLNFIPFYIQIRGISLQFIIQEVIVHIGRAMGKLMDIDYNAAVVAQAEYIRVRLNWDVAQPLCFLRPFQFTPGVNTLLCFRFERLHVFREVCGMLTHNSGNCLIQNGGGEHNSDDDSDADNDDQGGNIPGPHIQEIVEGEHAEADQNGGHMNLDMDLEYNHLNEAAEFIADEAMNVWVQCLMEN